MEMRIHYQGTGESPWMNEYLESKVGRLERYLPSGALVRIELSPTKCRISVTTHKHDYQFLAEGNDSFEAFTHSFEDALRSLRFDHQLTMNRIHHRVIQI